MRKFVATVAVLCGLGLIVVPFALSLFDRAPAGERITNRFRETMSVTGLHSLSGNFATMGALVDQFIHQASPQLARELHMTRAQYDTYVDRQFPAVAAGVRGLPPLIAFVTPVAAQLEALHPQFAGADSLPFLGLPLTTVPWILLGLGGALIALGILVVTSRTRRTILCSAALGAALIIVPLALDYPSKASDATKIAAVGRVALSAQAARGAQTANRLIDGMVNQVDAAMIPALAGRLHVSTPALEASLARRFPAVVRGLTAWPSIRAGAIDLVHRQVASVGDGAKMNGLHFGALPWFIMGPGIVLLLSASAALALDRGPRRRWSAAPELPMTGARLS